MPFKHCETMHSCCPGYREAQRASTRRNGWLGNRRRELVDLSTIVVYTNALGLCSFD